VLKSDCWVPHSTQWSFLRKIHCVRLSAFKISCGYFKLPRVARWKTFPPWYRLCGLPAELFATTLILVVVDVAVAVDRARLVANGLSARHRCLNTRPASAYSFLVGPVMVFSIFLPNNAASPTESDEPMTTRSTTHNFIFFTRWFTNKRNNMWRQDT